MSLLTEFEPGFTIDGGLPGIIALRQAASQTFTQGQCVITDASAGAVTEPASAAVDILGVSSMDADNDSNLKKVGIWVLDDRTIFKATATTPANVAVSIIFDLVDFERTPDTAAGVHTVNENASTQDVFEIVDITAVGGRLFVKAGGGSQWLHEAGAALSGRITE